VNKGPNAHQTFHKKYFGVQVRFDSKEEQQQRIFEQQQRNPEEQGLDPEQQPEPQREPYDPPDPLLLSLHAALCRANRPRAAGEKSDDVWDDDDFAPLLYDHTSKQDYYDKVMKWLAGLPEDSKYDLPEAEVKNHEISRDDFDAKVEEDNAAKVQVILSNSGDLIEGFREKPPVSFEPKMP